MTDFTPWLSLGGGILIGLSVAILFLFNGKIGGISGILGEMIRPAESFKKSRWNFLFVLGFLLGGICSYAVAPSAYAVTLERSATLLCVAGLLVGFGTSMANGCTSGHGICGVSRFSSRSIIATCVFMATGIGTVSVYRFLTGGL